MSIKLPITAMVVGRNEAKLLDRCFASLFFCDEILYTDILSSDNSKVIAAKYNAVIFDSDLIPSCEFAQAKMVYYAKNDWIIFIDPDEYIDCSLANQIIHVFPNLNYMFNVGAIIVPWQFYFNNKKLKGTVWGNNEKFLVVNKDRFTFKPIVHYGRALNSGFDYYKIPVNQDGSNVLHHEWMPNFKVFITKHIRYLKSEGKDRYRLGNRISYIQLLRIPLRAFRHSYYYKKGYKDGYLGLFLSFFWTFYQTLASFDLYLYCKGLKKVK